MLKIKYHSIHTHENFYHDSWVFTDRVWKHSPCSRIPGLLFNTTQIRFRLPHQPDGGETVLLGDSRVSDIRIKTVMNPHLCHLSLDTSGLQGSHSFLSCSRAVKVHKAVSWGDKQDSEDRILYSRHKYMAEPPCCTGWHMHACILLYCISISNCVCIYGYLHVNIRYRPIRTQILKRNFSQL